eukprot:1383300-Rhodomonas_salina.1
MDEHRGNNLFIEYDLGESALNPRVHGLVVRPTSENEGILEFQLPSGRELFIPPYGGERWGITLPLTAR